MCKNINYLLEIVIAELLIIKKKTDCPFFSQVNLVCQKPDDPPKFEDKYYWFARVETKMSQYDRKTGVKYLGVRCLKMLAFVQQLKVAGNNILMASVFRNQGKINNDDRNIPLQLLFAFIIFFWLFFT